jgi:hypothetical protein
MNFLKKYFLFLDYMSDINKQTGTDEELNQITTNIELEWDRLEKEQQKIELEKENLKKEKLNFEKDKAKLEKKLGIHLFNSTVKKMFDDDKFVKSLDEKISEITKDGKVDLKDLPELMLIVLEVTDNLNKFNLTYDEVLLVLEEFIIYIIETKNLVENKDKEDITRLIKTVIKLTMARPVVSKWFKKMWGKLKSKLCCS